MQRPGDLRGKDAGLTEASFVIQDIVDMSSAKNLRCLLYILEIMLHSYPVI